MANQVIPMVNELQPTPGSDWRRENTEGVLVELPSGKVARIRSINIALLLKLGRIPESMTQLVVDAVFEGKSMEFDLRSVEKLQTFLQLADGICETCFVSPRIVKVAKAEDEITVDDVDLQDKMFLFRLLNLPASALATFREEQESHVASVDGEPGHETATE